MNELCVQSFPLVAKPDLENAIIPTVAKLDRPNPSWTQEELGEFAKWHDDVCAGLGRQMAIHRYYQGHALTLARKRISHGAWGFFLIEYGISSSSDSRARKLYKKVKSEEELDGLTINDAYQQYGIEKPRKQNLYAHLLASFPAGSDDLAEEVFPDDLPGLKAACEQARMEMKEVKSRIKAMTATEEDPARHTILLRRWLLLMHKRDQAKARQERQERLQEAQERRLEKMEKVESEAAKVYVLLEETCGLMEQLYGTVCSVDPTLTERQEFSQLIQRFAELAEDLSMRIVPI